MERNIIQFKGIVRNTPGSSSEDGQFDEVQNLRFRDGAWRPVLDPLPLKGYEDGEHSKAGQYVTHYIHATSDYKHLLGINKDKLYWIADLVVPDDDHDEVVCKWKDEPQEIGQCNEKARMVTNGNMCTFISQEDFFHIFFRAADSTQKYVVLGGMLTDGLSATEIRPDYAPALRVKGWVVDKDRYPDQWDDENPNVTEWKKIRNCKVARAYDFSWETQKVGGEADAAADAMGQAGSSFHSKMTSRLLQVVEQEKREGFLHGFFWACTALKMYDGTYILHSRPVLMQQAADEQIRFGKFHLQHLDFSGYRPGQTFPEDADLTDHIVSDDVFSKSESHTSYFSFLRQGIPYQNANHFLDYKIVGSKNSQEFDIENSSQDINQATDFVFNDENSCPYSKTNAVNEYEQFNGTILYSGRHMPNSTYGNFDPLCTLLYTRLFKYFSVTNISSPQFGCQIGIGGISHRGHSVIYVGNGYDYSRRLTISDNSCVKTADAFVPNFLMSWGIGQDITGNWDESPEILTTHNVLQLRADKMVEENYKDIVQSVAVFITPQVYGQSLNKTDYLRTDNYMTSKSEHDFSEEDWNTFTENNISIVVSGMPGDNALFEENNQKQQRWLRYHLIPTRRKDTDIRKELLRQRNFYKVKEFTWDEYQRDVVNHGWVTIDLKDVLSTLTEQETLNIDSYTRSEYYSSVCQYYNGKLHIANYKENQFTGWPATYFKSEGYNYIAQDEEDKDREIGKSKGSIGDSADNDTNAVTFNKMRQDVTASNLQVQRDFYKHHDGTQTLEIGTAGVAEAAWKADGIVIDESSLNTFFSKVKGYQMQIQVTVEDEDGNSRQYWRTTPLRYFSDLRLNAMLSFPDIRAKNMCISTYVQFEARVGNRYADKWALLGSKSFDLDTDNGFNLAVYLSEDLRHIWAVDWKKLAKLVQGDYTDIALLDNPPSQVQTTISEYPNQLKVSEVNNPLYYPPENTYVVSNGSIQAMENDSISMQAGQYGTSPLYVFSSDGIYGLMVDASGELTYTNSRCVARDVVSDPHAIESTEAGVLFPTRHGLMSISNQVVTELSEPVEGPVVPWFDPRNIEKLPQAQVAAGLCGIRSNADEDGNPQPVFKFGDGALSHAEEEFKTFVQGAVIGYNYIDKEIWVSKRGQGTYVLTRSGWTRLSVEADKYVADFPHYYLQRDNRLYWLGREKTEETVTGEDGTAASKKLAASCYFITRPVKLGSEDYKQALRLVLRCRLECEEGQMSSLLVWGSYDSRKWTCLGGIDRVGSVKDIGKVVNRTDCKYFRFAFFGRLQAGSVIDYAELSSERRLYAGKIR